MLDISSKLSKNQSIMLRWLKIGCWSTVVKIQKVKVDFSKRWTTVQTVQEWLKIGCWSTVVKIQKVKVDFSKRWTTVQTVQELKK
uniref:Uncharacterized protein n=1 Tax=Helianthus annuus TaxID=4232 RepID=A0A251VTI7_HELAN